MAGERAGAHGLGHAGQPALGVDLDLVGEGRPRGVTSKTWARTRTSLRPAPEPDGDPLGPVALVDRDELAADHEPGGDARRQADAALRLEAEVADLDHQLVRQRVGDLPADLAAPCAVGGGAALPPSVSSIVPLSPGSSCTSPGATAKSCTTTTCGRGSMASPVSIWLEPWVQPASRASAARPRRPTAQSVLSHRLLIRSPPRCGPVIDTRLSWPPGPLSKVKNRVLKPWHGRRPAGALVERSEVVGHRHPDLAAVWLTTLLLSMSSIWTSSQVQSSSVALSL